MGFMDDLPGWYLASRRDLEGFHPGACDYQTCRHQRTQAGGDQARQRATVAAVEKLSRSDRRFAATVDQWDVDPMLLNTPGGRLICVMVS